MTHAAKLPHQPNTNQSFLQRHHFRKPRVPSQFPIITVYKGDHSPRLARRSRQPRSSFFPQELSPPQSPAPASLHARQLSIIATYGREFRSPSREIRVAARVHRGRVSCQSSSTRATTSSSCTSRNAIERSQRRVKAASVRARAEPRRGRSFVGDETRAAWTNHRQASVVCRSSFCVIMFQQLANGPRCSLFRDGRDCRICLERLINCDTFK